MEILLFGIIREIVGKPRLSIPPQDQVHSVKMLKSWITERYPAVRGLPSIAIAVDYEFATDTDPLNSESEIAVIPPVSGG